LYGNQDANKEIQKMKPGIHPDYVECTVRCSCGNTFKTRSTKPELRIDLCNKCHPFYTGQQKFVDTGGRVQRFSDRYGSASAAVFEREQAKKAARAEAAAAEEAEKKAAREAKAAKKAQKAAEYAKKAEAEAKKAAEEAARAEAEAAEKAAAEGADAAEPAENAAAEGADAAEPATDATDEAPAEGAAE
jgi:large subunit ribosomal protein L31